MLKNLLLELNFSEKEAQVYLALLELGGGKAHDIAKKTGLNRTTIYDIIEVLMQKGLISKYKKGASAHFNALEPRHLLTYLDREKEEQAKSIEKKKIKFPSFCLSLFLCKTYFLANRKFNFLKVRRACAKPMKTR